MWKVVAADDEGYIREALKKLINWEKMNCDLVSVLEDGQELIQCIENESPDIVITDIQMPGVNGLEVCKYLYETRPASEYRSEEHTSELQSHVRISYAVFCL